MRFLASKLHRYMGAGLFMDLYTMVIVSPFIISLIEGHCNLGSSGYAEAF